MGQSVSGVYEACLASLDDTEHCFTNLLAALQDGSFFSHCADMSYEFDHESLFPNPDVYLQICHEPYCFL